MQMKLINAVHLAVVTEIHVIVINHREGIVIMAFLEGNLIQEVVEEEEIMVDNVVVVVGSNIRIK